ncbi:class I SAM-dependent methyltransferase [Leifsonia sp. AG29]|uniref:class I SAM-dependent methyltransferase n=1 Tax=Leifsonia sp. AG29 TaxID=2598860 RepID=UPI00131B502B|nr:methyltransferase domain-containing protein [Leifsonia sp. AG29]
MSTPDRTRERLIETYRRKAAHYDTTSRLYPVPGYPQHSQRLRAVAALGLREGDTVVEVACGTGLNFGLVEGAIGSSGRLIGVDLTDAMLARAAARVHANGWSNVTLVQSDAAEFAFPGGVGGILSTYALTQVPGSAAVIAHGAAALNTGRRWAVLDLKLPDGMPRWLSRLGSAVVPTSASLDEWVARRPWEAIRRALDEELDAVSWTELCFGTAFLAVGCGGPRAPEGVQRRK